MALMGPHTWHPGSPGHPGHYQPFPSASLSPRRTMSSQSQPLPCVHMERKIQPPVRVRTKRFQTFSSCSCQGQGSHGRRQPQATHQAGSI